jgi:hypothetical protein
MAQSESSGGSTAIVAIFAIMLMLVIAGFIAWKLGVFGGGGKSLDINVNTPSSK